MVIFHSFYVNVSQAGSPFFLRRKNPAIPDPSREDVAHLSADGSKKIKGRSPIFEADLHQVTMARLRYTHRIHVCYRKSYGLLIREIIPMWGPTIQVGEIW